MELKITSPLGGEYDLANYIPASLAKYKIEGATPWYACGNWGELLMQELVTSRGSVWDTWYLMLTDCVLKGSYNHPVTEMQNAISNSFAGEMNGRARVSSREGRGKITHETHMENYSYFGRGQYHTRDLHLLPEKFESIANDHPNFEQLLGCSKKGEHGYVEGEITVRGRIAGMLEDFVNPYCAPGLIPDYHDSKFSEIIMAALWQIDRKDPHQPLKITAHMRELAIAAEKYLRDHTHEQVPYKILQQKLQTNIQSIKVAFKLEFGRTLDDYGRKLKMEAAHLLLLNNPTAEISEVAIAVGYQNPVAFSRRFKKHFGYPPGKLQK